MKKISNSTLLNIFTKLLILILIAKAISLALWFYLPDNGEELQIKDNYQPKYHRVTFKNMIDKSLKYTQTTQKEKIQEAVKNSINITNMILKGLYGASQKGFAIVALKKKPKKTTIIAVGEIFEGYKLTYINPDNIVFTKDDKEYILTLKIDKNSSSITRFTHTKQNLDKKSSNKQINTKEQDDKPRDVSRGDIAYFARNPKQIWREISIKEVKKNGKIMGFKIRRIAKRSRFEKLGLKRGDIIIKANNIELTSYRDALKLYKDIDNIDTMQIVILRDNQEKELIYEIH